MSAQIPQTPGQIASLPSHHIIEVLDAETTNPIEMQKAGWQAFLDNFKNIVKFLKKIKIKCIGHAS